ncbi:phosphotransferase family protein [Saccharopolyspora cebuensis]|uniref:Phosphotransferase family protein n=1 Tax=Saccharopolyspora cebuensis TaxID=418759 RepID=A0ABV4CQF9_9PSEU
MTTSRETLLHAAHQAGLDATDARLLRDGSNAMWLLPTAHAVARIGPEDTAASATRQVHLARWLATTGLPAVRPLDGPPQPTISDGRPVTWWVPLPDHRPATPGELGTVLRALHQLEPPEDLPEFDPFAAMTDRITAAPHLDPDDRSWLLHRTHQLHDGYRALPPTGTTGVLHGDAWQGNVAVPTSGGEPILLDLEHLSTGPQEWDLIPLAVDHTDFARLTPADYHDFTHAYGTDATHLPHYRLLADIQELRWTTYLLTKTHHDPSAQDEAAHRIQCLRGTHPHPWTWTAF